MRPTRHSLSSAAPRASAFFQLSRAAAFASSEPSEFEGRGRCSSVEAGEDEIALDDLQAGGLGSPQGGGARRRHWQRLLAGERWSLDVEVIFLSSAFHSHIGHATPWIGTEPFSGLTARPKPSKPRKRPTKQSSCCTCRCEVPGVGAVEASVGLCLGLGGLLRHKQVPPPSLGLCELKRT